MLTSMKELQGYTIQALDGEMGKLEELYFDDESWIVRYLVVNVGNWLLGKQVLIVPKMIERIDREADILSVALTREEVRNSPDIETHKTVTREKEEALHAYYNWQPYWQGALVGTAAIGTYPAVPTVPLPPEPEQVDEETAAIQRAREVNEGSSHLQSTAEIKGYYIKASDGDIGHVDDFIIDTEAWIIRYLIVDTGNWLPGKKVLISPGWVKGMRWPDSEVYVAMTRESIKNSPEYDPEGLVSRDYELQLYDYYDEPPYWKS